MKFYVIMKQALYISSKMLKGNLRLNPLYINITIKKK